MINLDQSIAKVKEEIESSLMIHVSPRETLIEAIMHEGAGRDRKTLLAWLNEQEEALPEEPIMPGGVEVAPDKFVGTSSEPQSYRPEKRGNVWCLYDVNNGVMRQETFEVKGDARKFIADLELYGAQIVEKPFHYLRSE